MALDSPSIYNLNQMVKNANSIPALKTYINQWSTSLRSLVYYHEVMHFKRVSDPWCGGDEVYVPKSIVTMAKDPYQYDRSLQNAHSWVYFSTCISGNHVITNNDYRPFLQYQCG